MNQPWQPSVGAQRKLDGVHFRVWSPTSNEVELVLEGEPAPTLIQMKKTANGVFEYFAENLQSGALYRYRLDGRGPFPDPTSRFQPHGVHGPSEVVDTSSFPWTDSAWKGIPLESLVVYELHIGTFTASGTFLAAIEKLPHLVELGVTAVELMPLADFPGERGWGYDGVSLYAPARCYGRPDDLRRFVNAAHQLGLAVLIDVVYNHLGPDGNYLSQFSPHYFSTTHQTDWGTGPNFDGEHNEHVVAFFVENALHWIHEYHFDGLRLDATHAIVDEGDMHILERLAKRVHAASNSLGRKVLVIAEDERNLNTLVRPEADKGYGLDAVWADDLHHQIRRALTGEKDGYYADYTGSTEDIARTLREGWFYQGQISSSKNVERGTVTNGIPLYRFVVCIQNHDQIGNRAFGERLNHQIDWSAFRAASTLLLTAPQTPLLYMGQEWAASSPFLYFTDHNPELGALVTEGRRREFRHFAAFNNPYIRTRIPDPQEEATFLASKLNWEEREREPHAGILRLYRELLRLRKTEAALQQSGALEVKAIAAGTLAIRRDSTSGQKLLTLVALTPGNVVALNEPGWSIVLTTEDPEFAPFARRPKILSDNEGTVVHFPCPAAIVFRYLPR